MINTKIKVNGFDLGHIGWKYYNTIRKKAMESEFSWSGLGISLSIAFFIVLVSSETLSLIYQSLEKEEQNASFKERIYQLEKLDAGNNNLNVGNNSAFLRKILAIQTAQAAGEDKKGTPLKNSTLLKGKWGEEINHTFEFKNTGRTVWQKDRAALETGPSLKSFSIYRHDSWPNFFRLARLAKDVKPGETAVFTVKLKIPTNVSDITQENFQMVENNFPIAGTLTRVLVDVTAGTKSAELNRQIATNNTQKFCIASAEISPDCQTDINESDLSNGLSEHVKMLASEPVIRVGLFNSTAAQRIKGNVIYDVYAGNQMLLSGIAAGTVSIVSFNFQSKEYAVSTPSVTRFAKEKVRFIPRGSGIFTLLDYPERSKDNQFRNIVEFQYSTATAKLWAINELPIEAYLKGLAESSNNVPIEFQKVLITAARTYAMYHYNRGIEYSIADGSTKHANEHFHLDATFDQVYRGYGAEMRLPTLTKAVDETRGATVTYNDKIVITPYFSRSDGRTRSWEEVWYGDGKPWLKSVVVPEDQGQTLWGHGVGMSARGALLMVRDKGKSWQETLKYFYQGVQIQKFYK